MVSTCLPLVLIPSAVFRQFSRGGHRDSFVYDGPPLPGVEDVAQLFRVSFVDFPRLVAPRVVQQGHL